VTTVPILPTVGCAVITKNEERNLLNCLQSVNWVGEGVVIDAESSDRTAYLARGGGRNKKTGAMPVSLFCLLQTVSLLEDIQPVS
jgi:glycosyltransferase involved in cell wall biosynthesis